MLAAAAAAGKLFADVGRRGSVRRWRGMFGLGHAGARWSTLERPGECCCGDRSRQPAALPPANLSAAPRRALNAILLLIRHLSSLLSARYCFLERDCHAHRGRIKCHAESAAVHRGVGRLSSRVSASAGRGEALLSNPISTRAPRREIPPERARVVVEKNTPPPHHTTQTALLCCH